MSPPPHVIQPSNVPRVQIRPPMTIGDKGVPSKAILSDVERIFLLIEDERHLVAQGLYHDVLRRLKEFHEEEQQAKLKKRRFRRTSKKGLQRELNRESYIKAQDRLDTEAAALDKLEV